MNPVNLSNAITTPAFLNTNIDSELDPIIVLKSSEMFLYANCKTDNKLARDYLHFLLDLHRYEEAYKMAVEISEFLPDYKRILAIFAVYLNDENIVRKHVNHFTLAKDGRNEDWLSLLVYHRISETIDELIYTHPLPDERDLKAILYYFANDDIAIYTLLSKAKHLCELEEWLLWISCCRLNYESEKQEYLDRIITKNLPLPPPYFKKDILTYLGCELDSSNKEKVTNFLKCHLKKYPGCLSTIKVLAKSKDENLRNAMTLRLKRLLAAYPSVSNKHHLVIIGPGDKNVKFEGLVRTFKTAPLNRELFNDLFYSPNISPELQNELIMSAKARSKCLWYEITFVLLQLNKIEKQFSKEEAQAILNKINSLLEDYPHNRILIAKKAYILALLEKTEESVIAFKKYTSLFGITMPLLETIDSVSSILSGEFILSTLREGFNRINNKQARDALVRAYILHNEPLQGIDFVISTLSRNADDQKKDFESIELLLGSNIKLEAHSLIDKVSRLQENMSFVECRANYYAQIPDEKALEDIQFIQKFNPTEAKKIRITFLVTSRQSVDAAKELLASKIDCSDEMIEIIMSQLFNRGEHKLMDDIFKKFKPTLSIEARMYLAISYFQTGRSHDALPQFKQLIIDNPGDENCYFYRAACFENLNVLGSAIDTVISGLELIPDSELLQSYKQELEEKQNKINATQVKEPVKPAQPKSKPKPDPKKVTYLIQDSNKKNAQRKLEPKGPKAEKVKKVLQNAPAHAVDPLADPLAAIKEIARIGEAQIGPKPKETPVPMPALALIRSEPPKAIVKLHLSPREKVFLKKAHVALVEYNTMKEALLDQSIVFRNQIYTILRAFTPLRLNSKHTQLVKDLIRIRDNARHDTDQLSQERLNTLFTYLKSIHLEHQLLDWIREKSIINRLMLQNHHVTVRKPKKTPQERVIQELEFIIKNRRDKETWKDRLYHRNAIKASLSIIGEASNFLAEDLKALFAEYRTAGNDLAHEFFVDGETLENVERLKEEDITPDELWALAQNAENLLARLERSKP